MAIVLSGMHVVLTTKIKGKHIPLLSDLEALFTQILDNWIQKIDGIINGNNRSLYLSACVI